MAVDTRQKRQSAVGFPLPSFMGVSPTGTFALGERMAAGNVYAGILANTAATHVFVVMNTFALTIVGIDSGAISTPSISSGALVTV